MQEQYRSILKNTVILGGTQLVQMTVLLVRAKAIAVLLGPLGSGINSLILSAVMLMQQVSSMGIYQSGVREMSTINDSNKLARFRAIFMRLTFICSLGGVIIMALLSPILSLILFKDWSYTWWLMLSALTLFFMGFYSGYSTIMQATRNLSLLAKSTIVGSVVGLLFAVVCFYFLGLRGIVPAIIGGYLSFSFSFRYFERKISFEQVGKIAKQELMEASKPVLKLGVVLMASAIVATLFTFILNAFISNFGSTIEVGFYQSAASIITQGMLITNVVLASDFYPRLTGVHTDLKQMQIVIKHQTDILLCIIAPISVLIIAFAPVIVWLLLSPEFTPVVNLLQTMSLALVFKVVWTMMSYILLAKGDKKAYFYFDALLGNGVSFLMSIIGFYFWGLNGLAYAYLIGALFMVVLLWLVTKVRVKSTVAYVDLIKMTILGLLILFAYFWVHQIILLTIISIAIVGYSVLQLNRKIHVFDIIKNKLNR